MHTNEETRIVYQAYNQSLDKERKQVLLQAAITARQADIIIWLVI